MTLCCIQELLVAGYVISRKLFQVKTQRVGAELLHLRSCRSLWLTVRGWSEQNWWLLLRTHPQYCEFLLKLSDSGILVIVACLLGNLGLTGSNCTIDHLVRTFCGKVARTVTTMGFVLTPGWPRARECVLVRLPVAPTARHCTS